MITKRRAILAMFLCTFFMAGGSTMFKYAADTAPLNWWILLYWPIFAALIIYAFAGALMIWGFLHGELSVLYPIISLNFIWTAFTSWLIIGEPMNTWKWAGTIIILLGATTMSLESIYKRWKQLSGQLL